MSRKTKKLQPRNQFFILTNGQETEYNYFDALKGSGRSIYDVKIKFVNADPLKLVNRAINEKSSANRVWVVFDMDQFPKDMIEEAMRLARKEGIGIAFSNIAFEVWLVEHFKELNAEKTNAELQRELDARLKEIGYSAGYSKNDVQAVKKVFLPRLETAMHNADVSLQRRIAEYNSTHSAGMDAYPYWAWNPCTTVHKLVEAMKLETRK